MGKISTILSLAGLLGFTAAFGQMSFHNASADLNMDASYSGVAIGVVDMNADGFDDIVHLQNGRILTIEYQKPDGTGFATLVVGSVSTMSQWSMCVSDVDNNGYNDVLTGGRYDGVKVFKASEDGASFTMTTLPGATMFIQGSNFADINNDGWLDVFACHDDGESRIWGNTGTGDFEAADDWIDMATVPASDNSGNYGSIWTDFDNDGDLDLYIAKCRQGVNNSSDPRRINALFVNDGTNHFTENAAAANLKIGAQSWTADFGDIDNDGDLDVFITNHDVPSMLLLNDGAGVFTDITSTSGITISALPLEGVFRDFDNDGFVDIIVAGTGQYIFHNNGDHTFSQMPNPFGANAMESFAIGDLNHDGKLDVYAGYADVYTTPSNKPDLIWMNTTDNGNHFLNVSLVGATSNRNGVGARISIYGSWGVQIREVRSGESYGIMNSFAQNFGLGTATSVDSILVRWPGGNVDTYYNLDGDQFLTLIEGACVSPSISIEVDGPTTFCPGEQAQLSVPEGFNYMWSNGATGSSITVTEQGTYSVVVSDSTGCYTITAPVEITVDPVVTPTVAALSDTVFCQGGSVILSTEDALSYAWSTGETSSTISVSTTGDYSVTVPGLCSNFTSAAIHVEVLPAPAPQVMNDTIHEPGEAVLIALGNHPNWFLEPTGGDPFFTGDTLIIPNLTETVTYYVEDETFYPGPGASAGAPEHTGNSLFSGSQYNGQMFFDVLVPVTLKTVKVYTDMPGIRIIELYDQNATLIGSDTVNITEGEQIIDLNFEIPAGSGYYLTTNTAQNQTLFGYNSPRLRRTNGATVTYPYVTPGVLSVTGSSLGQDVYYYFYDWQVKLPDQACISERAPVQGVFEVIIGTDEPDAANASVLKCYPNPTGGTITIETQGWENASQLTITDVIGQQILQRGIASGETNTTLDLGYLPNGVYNLQLRDTNGKIKHNTLVIQH